MIKIAQVINIQDPLEQGRIQVRVYPEFKEMKSSDLPWAFPNMTVYENRSCIPKVNSFLYIEVSEDWIKFTYLDSIDYILDNYRYGEVKEILDGIAEIETVNYPNPDFKINPNGFIEFYNQANTETGYIHPSGTFVVFKENGDYYIKNPDQFEMHFSENKIEMKNLEKFIIGDGVESKFDLDLENKKLDISKIEEINIVEAKKFVVGDTCGFSLDVANKKLDVKGMTNVNIDSTNVTLTNTTKVTIGSATELTLGAGTDNASLYGPLKTILTSLATHTHSLSGVPFTGTIPGPITVVGTVTSGSVLASTQLATSMTETKIKTIKSSIIKTT